MSRPVNGTAARARTLEVALTMALILLGVLIVLNQANPLTTPLRRNSGTYAYMAELMLRGETPYISAWNHKPPMIFFIDALALWLGKGTRWGIWLVEFVAMLVGAFSAFDALRRRFGPWPALLGSGLWLVALPAVLMGGNFTEEYALLFSFVSLWLFSLLWQRPDSLWLHIGIGLAFGFNFLLRPNNAGVQAAIFIAEAVLIFPKLGWRGAIKSCLAIGAGVLLPLAAASWYFAARGAFSAFIEASFTYNLIYSAQPDVLSSLLSGVQLIGAPAWMAVAGVGVAFWLLARDARSRSVEPFVLWLCLDFIIEVTFSGLSGRDIFHYFISWMPFIAVSGALLARQLVPRLRGPGMQYAIPILTVLLVGLLVGFRGVLATYARTAAQLATDRSVVQKKEALAEYVHANTRPGETVLVWGDGAGANFLSHRDAPTPYFLYWNLVPCSITDRISAQFMEDLRARPPALIIDAGSYESAPLSSPDPLAWYASKGFYAQPHMQEFFDFLHQDYAYVTSVGDDEVYALQH